MACEESTCWNLLEHDILGNCSMRKVTVIFLRLWRERLSFVNALQDSTVKWKAMEQLEVGKRGRNKWAVSLSAVCVVYTHMHQIQAAVISASPSTACYSVFSVVSSVLVCHDWSLAIPSLDVLSEEQIRLKKMKKQEDDQARTVVVRPNPPNPPSPSHKLTPEQLSMIKKLVAAQQQCNQRSFTDRLKVTVKTLPVFPKSEEVWGVGFVGKLCGRTGIL